MAAADILGTKLLSFSRQVGACSFGAQLSPVVSCLLHKYSPGGQDRQHLGVRGQAPSQPELPPTISYHIIYILYIHIII